MSRIFWSFVVILGSTILYLSLRKLNYENKITVQIQNLLMFWPATIVFFVIWMINKEQFFIQSDYILYIGLSSFFFSFLWNYFSLVSIKQSANPGYSLMISKSYVILTALVSIFLFESHLLFTDIIAILLIVVFSGFILIDKKDNQTKWYKRIITAFYSFLARWGLALANKWFLNLGMSPTIVNFWMFLFVTLICIGDFAKTRWSYWDLPKITLASIGVVVWMIVFNCWLMYWYKHSSNPWFISAANASSIAIITVCSAIFFGDDISMRKWIGIIGIIVWICVLMIF